MGARLTGFAGWRRNLAAFFLGITTTLTLAPFCIFPFVIVAFGGLYLLVVSAPTHKRAFWDGWWWGWGFHITGLYWFCVALLTDVDKFAWLIPFALFGITGVIAIYAGIACWIASRLRVQGIRGVFLFSFIWLGIEFARGHLFSGFPWNLEGYSFSFSDASLQLASLVGAYGLTWFAVLLGVIPAVLCDASVKKKSAVCMVLCVYAVFFLGVLWGAGRLYEADQIPVDQRYVQGIQLRLVQANMAQNTQWDPRRQLATYLHLTQAPGIDTVTHVIWPEGAVARPILAGMGLSKILGEDIPEYALLITGAPHVEHNQYFNGITALTHDGAIIGNYDKSKLVPFGEFLPFRNLLPKAWTTPVGDTDFSRGNGPQTLEWGGIKVSPLVCYEAIFPELAVAPQGERPELLLNVTNDAWFGMSSGPYQHFAMARVRAVEQGIPLARAANTGISAVTDSFGRIVLRLPLGTQGVLDSPLPKAQSVPTFYVRQHNLLFYVAILSGAFFLLARKVEKN